MGNLIITKVSYSGEKYFFESPELEPGINIIVGDNGSGKSTFSYFIEYGLGGDIIPFKSEKESRYDLIIDDINNYVQLNIIINNKPYLIKRFIGKNDVFIRHDDVVEKFPIYRNAEYAPYIFSDWLLDKLNIEVFELSLGTSNWQINFKDIYRLLNYDQYTESSKIFKSPPADNYISDSLIIRKAIFETLVGVSSQEFNIIFNDFKTSQNEKNDAKTSYDNYINIYPWLETEKFEVRQKKLVEYNEQLDKLYSERQNYQIENTASTDKTILLGEIQSELIGIELEISENSIRKNNYEIELTKTRKLLELQSDEISQIEKIIFTHDKLNLFSLEICPFCMSDIENINGICICGSKINDEDYEKFVYKSSEYKEILDHKKKSILAINIASDSYQTDIINLEKQIGDNEKKSYSLKEELKKIINTIAFSGNSNHIDRINDTILKTKESILNEENTIRLLTELNRLEKDYKDKNETFKSKKKIYESANKKFEENNKKTIRQFNTIYSELLSKSSIKSAEASINEDYQPIIDGGVYKQKSAIVPIRLMYYFTLLSLALKNDSVKHPKFLLIDTPENAGIDEGNLKLNLELLDLVINSVGKKKAIQKEPFQIILTTGVDKYPETYSKYIKLIFSEKNKDFILKSR